MGKKEESAIDAIYSMRDSILLLDKKINLIDGNVKLIANKLSKLQKTINGGMNLPSAANENIKVSPPNTIEKTGKASDKYITGPVKTYGKIVSKGKVPIPDVQVSIFNENGDVVKQRTTDSDGYWEVRLPAGKFGVEYIHKKFKPINLTIELARDITEFEVT